MAINAKPGQPRRRQGTGGIDSGDELVQHCRVSGRQLVARRGKIRIRLANDPVLRIGAFARGTVEVARREGIAVPVSSLLYAADGRASVLVAKDGRVEARTVTTGLSSEGFTEIRSGVAAGETVVARAGSFLRDGDRVRAVPRPSAGTPMSAPASPPMADAAPR